MPAYQDVGFRFNNEAFPGSATSGTQFALPSFTGTNDPGTAVRGQTIFGSAPTAVSIILQGAMADVYAEYQTIDTTTATTGEARSVTGVQWGVWDGVQRRGRRRRRIARRLRHPKMLAR
jgi:hypothetical protein